MIRMLKGDEGMYISVSLVSCVPTRILTLQLRRSLTGAVAQEVKKLMARLMAEQNEDKRKFGCVRAI